MSLHHTETLTWKYSNCLSQFKIAEDFCSRVRAYFYSTSLFSSISFRKVNKFKYWFCSSQFCLIAIVWVPSTQVFLEQKAAVGSEILPARCNSSTIKLGGFQRPALRWHTSPPGGAERYAIGGAWRWQCSSEGGNLGLPLRFGPLCGIYGATGSRSRGLWDRFYTVV